MLYRNSVTAETAIFPCIANPVLSIIRLLDLMAFGGQKMVVMRSFYYETWLPFVITKRRILVLAIASYIALC